MLENELNRPRHLLIMRLSAIGDVAMTVPIVLALRQQYPKLKITVVSRPFFQTLFTSIDNVDFYAADVENDQSGITGLYKLYKNLSLRNIDAFADLHNVLRSKIVGLFFKLAGVKVAVIHKGRIERKKLTALKPKTRSPIKSMIQRHADVCKTLGLPIDLSKVELPGAQNLSREVLGITGEKDNKWVGIAPFATYETKMYPLQQMQQVIDLILQKGYKIFLFGGGKKEVEQLQKMASVSDECVNIAGKFNFKDELTLISHLDLMISMDSGNGHIAALYGIPVITMWGNTHPSAGFIPFRQTLKNSILPDLNKYPYVPTSVYGNKIVDGYKDCMKSIQPQEVVQKVTEILS